MPSVTAGEGSEEGDDIVPLTRGTGEDSIDGPISMRVNNLISHSIDDKCRGPPNPNVLADLTSRAIESAASLDAIMSEYGAPFGVSQMLIAALPSREHCDALLDHFFEHVNWLRMPLSRKRLLEKVDTFWASGPVLTANNINPYAILMFIMAIATTTYRSPSGPAPEDPRAVRLIARRLFFAGRQALLYSTMLGREDLEHVIAFHTASRFLFLDRRISEAWTCVANAIKAAHSIGLHRDGTFLKMSKPDSEARRRIWSYVYFSDRILCMNLGRPTAVDDDVVDTQLPSDEDESDEFADYLEPSPGVTVPESEKPRFLTMSRMRHKLAIIMGRVMSTYQNLHNPAHYSDVIAIDQDLMALHRELPDHLRSDFTPQGTIHHIELKWDHVYKFVGVHRYLIESEIFFVRMSLHRPYLIRPSATRSGSKGSSSSRYSYSRRSCIEAAHNTLMLRKDLVEKYAARLEVRADTPPPWALHLGNYNVLHAIVITGISLLLDPHSEFSAARTALLREMHERWQTRKTRGAFLFDETKERDMVILQIFVERIDAAQKGARKRPAQEGIAQANESSEQGTKSSAGVIVANGDNKRPRRQNSDDRRRSNQRGEHGAAASTSSKEEDTAGVLLDLNQSNTRRAESTTQPSYTSLVGGSRGTDAVRGSGAAGHATPSSEIAAVQADENPMPWPYLPTRMPHHGTSNNTSMAGRGKGGNGNGAAGNGDSSANAGSYEGHSASSGGEPTPPAGSSSGTASMSADDDPSASVHQLFDSWFRYNAFETMEFDSLAGLASGMGGPNSQPGVQQEKTISPMFANANAPVSGGGGGGAFGLAPPGASWGLSVASGALAGVQSPQPYGSPGPASQQAQQPYASAAGPWSMPPSSWPVSMASEQSGQQGPLSGVHGGAISGGYAPGSNLSPDVGPAEVFGNNTGSLVGPAGATGLRGPGPTGADAGSTTEQQQQMTDASYDPMFWQSLIDKISG